jgi:hypothetical protein
MTAASNWRWNTVQDVGSLNFGGFTVLVLAPLAAACACLSMLLVQCTIYQFVCPDPFWWRLCNCPPCLSRHLLNCQVSSDVVHVRLYVGTYIILQCLLSDPDGGYFTFKLNLQFFDLFHDKLQCCIHFPLSGFSHQLWEISTRVRKLTILIWHCIS